MRNVNKEHREKLSALDKLALKVTRRVGSMGFFFIVFCWTAGWLLWNFLAPEELKFDPYPAFVMWLFISNMIQILLMPLIMIGQNLESRHNEARAEADFEINLKAEHETEIIMKSLENQSKDIEKIKELFEAKSK